MSPLKVAIIGSNGFIARHLINRLKATGGLELVLFGRSPYSNFGNEFQYNRIDFHDNDQLAADFTGIDIVYYMVSETIPSTSWEDPLIEIEKNLVPFTKFLNTISKLNIKKFAFISSAGTVYGATTGKVEESSDKKPFSPYGIIKLAMENLLNYYHVKYNLNYDVYRVSNVYGEGQDISKGLGIINTFLEKIICDKKVVVFGDGSATRNYIYAGDVAELLNLSVRDTATCGTYNISSDCTISINKLVQILQESIPDRFDINYVEARQSDNSYIDLDNSRILARAPGFKFTDISTGIKRTYDALKSEKSKKLSNG